MNLQDIIALAGLVAGLVAVIYLDARRNGKKKPGPRGKPILSAGRILTLAVRRYAPFNPQRGRVRPYILHSE